MRQTILPRRIFIRVLIQHYKPGSLSSHSANLPNALVSYTYLPINLHHKQGIKDYLLTNLRDDHDGKEMHI